MICFITLKGSKIVWLPLNDCTTYILLMAHSIEPRIGSQAFGCGVRKERHNSQPLLPFAASWAETLEILTSFNILSNTNQTSQRMPYSHHSHSGQFCRHATGLLEDVVLEAIHQGFEIYGLTEHVPRYRAEDLYPEEVTSPLLYCSSSHVDIDMDEARAHHRNSHEAV